MRPIKFRAWDDQKGMMFPVWDIRQDDQFGLRINEGEYYDKTVGLLQFTGLKDKNGREIYEGDIVEAKQNPKGFKKSAEINPYLVEWLECDGFYFVSPPPFNCFMALGDADELGDLEVIGNMYEHPELMEVQE